LQKICIRQKRAPLKAVSPVSAAGNICHTNGTLSQLDLSGYGLSGHFPYKELAAFRSLNTLTLSAYEMQVLLKQSTVFTLICYSNPSIIQKWSSTFTSGVQALFCL